MVKKVGIIGFSEGNGHPYSFAALLNGYSKTKIKNSNSSWKVIDKYLLKSNKTKPILKNIKLTHINNHSKGSFKNLGYEISEKFNVDIVLNSFKEIKKEVDSIILAHDDVSNRINIERYLFKSFKGPIFFDKILTNKARELNKKIELINLGKIWSASGCRFTDSFNKYTDIVITKNEFFNFIIPNSWIKYGIHIIEFLYAKKVIKLKDKVLIKKKRNIYDIYKNDSHIGKIELIKDYNYISMYLAKKSKAIHLYDNYESFRKMLLIFFKSFKGKNLRIPEFHKKISVNSHKLLLNLKI